MALMGTVDETFARVQAEGIGVSKHFIRQSVISGALPCRMAGKKYLINWNVFLDFLNNPQPVASAGCEDTGIRQVRI